MPVEIMVLFLTGRVTQVCTPLTSTPPKLQFLKRNSLFKTINGVPYFYKFQFNTSLQRHIVKVCEAKIFQYEKHTDLLGVAPIPATVTTRITCLVGDSYQPSSLPGGNTQGSWDSVQEATGATKSWGPGMNTEIIFFGFGDCYKMQETYSAYHHK